MAKKDTSVTKSFRLPKAKADEFERKLPNRGAQSAFLTKVVDLFLSGKITAHINDTVSVELTQ